MLASVIVPCRDAAATLPRALEALAAQDLDENFEVIVVDDGSTDGSAEIARQASGVALVRSTGCGPGAARNAGVAASSGKVVAFTDADCFPHPSWLRTGAAALEGHGLVQGAVGADPAAALGPFDRTVWVSAENGLYETANLFVRRAIFDAVGGFEPWIVPEDGKELAEDVWLGWRIRRSGADTAFCEGARVDHAVFTRDARSFIAEHERLRHFPAIVARVPELRGELLFARVFLSRRTAVFDLALVAAGGAVAVRSPLPLAAVLPYLAVLARERRWRRLAPTVVRGRVGADAVALASLVRGSLAARSLVL